MPQGQRPKKKLGGAFTWASDASLGRFVRKKRPKEVASGGNRGFTSVVIRRRRGRTSKKISASERGKNLHSVGDPPKKTLHGNFIPTGEEGLHPEGSFRRVFPIGMLQRSNGCSIRRTTAASEGRPQCLRPSGGRLQRLLQRLKICMELR